MQENEGFLQKVAKISLSVFSILGLITSGFGVLFVLISLFISSPFTGYIMFIFGVFMAIQGIILLATNEVFKAILSLDENLKQTNIILRNIDKNIARQSENFNQEENRQQR